MNALAEPDAIAQRLAAFADELRSTLAGIADVRNEDVPGGAAVWVMPVNEAAIGVYWSDMAQDLQVATLGGPGGRWELGRTDVDVDFIEAIVNAVVAGQVTEVFALSRSMVEVRLADGSVVSEGGATAPRGCLPLPGWIQRGRRVEYAPYR